MVEVEGQRVEVKSQNDRAKVKGDLRSRCYQLSLSLIVLVDEISRDTSCRIIGDQLLRSGTSIGANLVEATASSSRREFKKFYEIALKSANETKYWLGLLRDSGKVDEDRVSEILIEVGEIANMVAAGVIKLKRQPSF